MVWIRLAPLVVMFVVGSVLGWTVNGWRLNQQVLALEKSYAEAMLQQKELAAKRAAVLQGEVDAARAEKDKAIVQVVAKDEQIAKLKVDVGRLRADLGSVRRSLSSYAAGSSAATTCSERVTVVAGLAAESAELLVEGAGLVEEGRDLLRTCAKDFGWRTAELKSVLDSWPRQPLPQNP